MKTRTCEVCEHVDEAEEIEFLPGGFIGNLYYCTDHIARAKAEANGDEFDGTDGSEDEEVDEPPYVETRDNAEGWIAILQSKFISFAKAFESDEGQKFKAAIKARLNALSNLVNSSSKPDYRCIVDACRRIEVEMGPWLYPKSR